MRLLLLLLSCLPLMVAAAPVARTSITLGSGWRFMQSGAIVGAERADFDDASWTSISVPHTWNRLGNDGVERSTQSDATQGIGWYRLHFAAPAGRDARFFLQFDAVGEIADVWLNGIYLGRHAGAFARFRFDATRAMRAGADNLLVVRADNSRPQPNSSTADVVPLSGDFFVFGGIYRAVSLIVTSAIHVDLEDFGGPGLYAHAASLDPARAEVAIRGRVANDGAGAPPVTVEFSIEAGGGQRLVMDAQKVSVPAGVSEWRALLRLDHPHLWQGMRDPYLYRCVMRLHDARGNLLDEVVQPLGLRTLRFDPEHGFFLNDEHITLKGVSRHQDRPVKGWAIGHPDIDEDFKLIEDMGANAVRFAHYQHDQYAYELADGHGLIAWAELPLVNQVSFDDAPASAALGANAQQQLRELIRQNFNHPAIALWSIGNEVDLLATGKRAPTHAGALLRTLNALAKQEDPSRATTLADCCEMGVPPQVGEAAQGAAPRESFAGIADTMGYNRYFGWYTGKFGDLGPMLDAAHARHPNLPIAVSEYGAGAALTQHSDDARGGPINPHGRPHPEEYQELLHEQAWPALNARKFLWATFVWNMFDFASPSRREGDLADINEKGLVSYDRQTLKDAYFYYRANWNSAPTLHLVGRRYTDRAYAVVDVKAYSNASSARLSVNQGAAWSASCSAGVCIWAAVRLAPGKNELNATAQIAGRELSDTMTWTLAHASTVVRIKAGDIAGCTVAGLRFGSDLYFAGGHAGSVDPPDTQDGKRTTLAIADAALFETFREGEFDYRIPLPDGRYRVELRFIEPRARARGERVFDVLADDTPRLSALDIFAASGGRLKPLTRDLVAASRDGILKLTFKARRGEPLVSALSITPLENR